MFEAFAGTALVLRGRILGRLGAFISLQWSKKACLCQSYVVSHVCLAWDSTYMGSCMHVSKACPKATFKVNKEAILVYLGVISEVFSMAMGMARSI